MAKGRTFSWMGHRGPIIDEAWDWDGGYVIFYCKKCRRLQIFRRKLISGVSELFMGEKEWELIVEDYKPVKH